MGPGGCGGVTAGLPGEAAETPPLTAARHAALGEGPAAGAGRLCKYSRRGGEAAHARCAHGAARVLTQCTGPGSRGEGAGPRM